MNTYQFMYILIVILIANVIYFNIRAHKTLETILFTICIWLVDMFVLGILLVGFFEWLGSFNIK